MFWESGQYFKSFMVSKIWKYFTTQILAGNIYLEGSLWSFLLDEYHKIFIWAKTQIKIVDKIKLIRLPFCHIISL